MATPVDQLDELISMTYDNFKPTLSDNVTDRTPLLKILDNKSNVTEDGGLTVVRPVMHGLNGTVKSYSDDEALDITRQGGFGHAKYDWKQIAGSIVFTGRDELINAGKSQIVNLIKSKFNQFEVSYADAIQTMLWAEAVGNSGKDLTGLPVIVDDAGTLGGIDPTTETWWKSKRGGDSAAAPCDLTTTAGLKVLQSVYNSLYTVGSGIDVEVTTQANYEAYHDLALEKLRFQNGPLTADLGIPTLAHFNASVMFDSYMPGADAIDEVGAVAGGDWFFLNTDRLEFVKHSRAWLKRRAPQHPDDKDMTIVLVMSAGELITDSRRSHGRIKFTKVA